ncbi:iron-sulfur cluster assembly scaffold protein [Wenxinia saemankumensis]|uniref:NifU homolog involved in Fe-S cluster formation n=1 Tax=Wenxinia saemankumensis TaxID=1447782 RepID=A0A1M6A151_9RHOB|nr:iron-sulfur cluster assembly scaffold protein [Wenxinia saemankumensis]SHI30190.1 NifU homolog involved in Fe-S cluster formation [Wenxinia saemankumensis]
MTAETDLIKLYSGRILALTAEIPHLGRLDAPDGSARKRSPLCGSTVTADVRIEDGRVAEFAQDVKACALGQASAAILGAEAIGLDEATLARGRDQLKAMLKEGGPVPDAPFAELEVLEPARDYKNRHPSILLAFEAILAAMEEARAARSA